MTGPLLALRAAIIGALTDDDTLAATMGGDVKLYDEPPAGSAPVYAVFGPAEARDDSVDGARRHRHDLALVVYGKPGSTRSAVEAADRIAALLDDAAPALAGHALVALRVEAVDARRDNGSGETRATVTLKAVTEVLPP